MGWIQCSVVSTRQKFVLKFYEMNMILRSLKEMEESKVSSFLSSTGIEWSEILN